MTQKTRRALDRILKREAKWRTELLSGAHPCGDGWCISDGAVNIWLPEYPDGFEMVEPLDNFHTMLLRELNKAVPLDLWEPPLDEWKQRAQGPMKDTKGGSVPIYSDQLQTMRFNPRLLVDAYEAVGPGAVAFAGGSTAHPRWWCLLVLHKDWRGKPWKVPCALVLPYSCPARKPNRR